MKVQDLASVVEQTQQGNLSYKFFIDLVLVKFLPLWKSISVLKAQRNREKQVHSGLIFPYVCYSIEAQ